MKKGMLLLLCICLLLSLSACGQAEVEADTNADGDREALAEAGQDQRESALTAGLPAPNDNTGVILQGTALGSLRCDDEYGTVFSEIWEVPEKGEITKRFYNYTDGLGMWNNFLVYLQSMPEGHTEQEGGHIYAILRADHFASGEGLDEAVLESDWNWETFTEDMNGALIELTVANKGETAEVSFTATTADETVYHQSYQKIAIDGPLYFCLSVDHACLDLLEDAEPEA